MVRVMTNKLVIVVSPSKEFSGMIDILLEERTLWSKRG